MDKENKKITLLFCIEFVCMAVSYFIIQGERAGGGTGFTPSTSTPFIIIAAIIFLVNLKYFTKHLGNALTKKQFSTHVLLFSLASLLVPIIALFVIYSAGMLVPA